MCEKGYNLQIYVYIQETTKKKNQNIEFPVNFFFNGVPLKKNMK